MRLFFLICLIFISTTPSFSLEGDQSAILSEKWINRPSPEAPSTDEENLAVLAALEHRDITRDNLAAKYDGIKGHYETVTVTTIAESESDMQVIFRYRILNRQICAATRPVYMPWLSSEKEKMQKTAERTAYQFAVRANGTNTDRPVIYGDKALSVTFDDKCKATVTEKDFDHEVVAVYRFDMCD